MKKVSYAILVVCLSVLFVFSSLGTITAQTEDVKISEHLTLKHVIGVTEKPGIFRMAAQDGSQFLPMYQQGLAVDDEGNIFVGDSAESQIEIFGKDLKSTGNFGSIGSNDGAFQYLTSFVIDKNDQFIAVDSYLGKISVFSKEGEFIRSFGTKGSSPNQLHTPSGIAILSSNEYIITDFVNGIKVYTQDGNYSKEFSDADEALPGDSEMSGFCSIAIDSNQMVYAVKNNYAVGMSQIIKFTSTGEFVGQAFLGDSNQDTLDSLITGISIDGNYLYISTFSSQGRSVRRFEINKDTKKPLKFIDTICSQPTGQVIENKDIILPTAVYAKNGKIYCVDGIVNKVIVFSDKKEFLGAIQTNVLLYGYYYGKQSLPEGILSNPQGVRVSSEGKIYVGNSNYNTVSIFNDDYSFDQNVGKFITSQSIRLGEFYSPIDLILDDQGYLYVSDVELNVVQVFSPEYEPFMTIDESFSNPQGLALDEDGNLLVVNSRQSTLSLIEIIDIADEMETELNVIPVEGTWPVGVDIDSDGNYFVALTGSDEVHSITPDGELITKIGMSGSGDGELSSPQGVCVDGDNNIYVAETNNGRIQKFTQNGELIWNSNMNWAGLTLVVMDDSGKLYVSDCLHGTILVLEDDTAVPPSGPKPKETNAVFSLERVQEKIIENDTFEIALNGKDMDLFTQIMVGIEYPENLIEFDKITVSPFLSKKGFQLRTPLASNGLLSFSSISSKNEIVEGDGALFTIIWKAKKAGNVKMVLDKVDIKTEKGIEVLFKEKQGLDFTIEARDTTPPILEIEELPDPVFEKNLLIKGKTEPQATVLVNANPAIVNEDGSFTFALTLKIGPNTITISATDKAGNKNEKTWIVNYVERTVIKLRIGSNVMMVNTDPVALEAPPFIDPASSRTLVPLRAIAEAIGAEVDYEAKEQRVDIKKGEISLTLWIGKPNAIVNGKNVKIDPDKPLSPMIRSGRTFLPLRFVAETFEFKVDWEASTQTITMTYPNPDLK
ncbi:hypothetical protein LLG10_03835 [bacterium]|nr:hypothetical protein [bacterium]